MTQLFQNIRKQNGDEKCIHAYAMYLRASRRAKSHSGPITAMSYRAMTGREIAGELGLGDEQVAGG